MNDVPSTEKVYQAVRELRNADQIATRETVAELTGLKLSVVDDRLRHLVNVGHLRRLIRGVYEVKTQFWPPRQISKTVLPDGLTQIEIGDMCVELTPQEVRRLSALLAGDLYSAMVIHSTNQHLFLANELASRVEALERASRAGELPL